MFTGTLLETEEPSLVHRDTPGDKRTVPENMAQVLLINEIKQFHAYPQEGVIVMQANKDIWSYNFIKEILEKEFSDRYTSAPLAAAYFDRTGCLKVLSGGEEYLQGLAGAGIREGAVWRKSRIGRNAVTICLEEGYDCRVTCGEENQPANLKNYDIYFCRIRLLDVNLRNYANQDLELGGIALLTGHGAGENAFSDSTVGMHFLDTLIHGIAMTLNCDLQLRRQYDRNKQGCVFLNTEMNSGRITATYINSLFYRIFESEPEEMDFCYLEDIFPRETNEQLWRVIVAREYVENKQIRLNYLGKRVLCLVTLDFWNQPQLHSRGCILCITTPKIENRKISKQIANSAIVTMDDIVGSSLAMENVKRKALLFATTDSNVMLLGESGVGKDVLAQAIHNASSRRSKPFVVINCGAIPRELIASELFGYESGAFTGARKNGNIGKFELAEGGTIFLDEIGELPLDLQASLLRLVEQKQFMRIGGHEMIHADVKIICATNVDLMEMIEKKQFRMDLFYRLSILTLQIPPLRERGTDVLELCDYFIRKVSRRIGRAEPMQLSEDAAEILLQYPWRGNVREVQNLMELIVQLYPDPVLQARHITDNLPDYRERNTARTASPLPSDPADLPTPPGGYRTSRKPTREQVLIALDKCGGRREATASLLGISRKTLYRYMAEYGLLK